jgi:hypothetical protein
MFEQIQYFPIWVQLKWKKKVCNKHISRAHYDQQTKHTKEHWHTIQWEMLLEFKSEDRNYSSHKTASPSNPH